jgi:hypothetical protein
MIVATAKTRRLGIPGSPAIGRVIDNKGISLPWKPGIAPECREYGVSIRRY